MPDLLTINAVAYPVVRCAPVPWPLTVRRRFSGHVGSDVTVAGAATSTDRPRGWDVVVGDLLTLVEADALVAVLEGATVTLAGTYVGGTAACSTVAVRKIPGDLDDMWSVEFRALSLLPGPPTP